jgi:multiple sugar transport system permease protein
MSKMSDEKSALIRKSLICWLLLSPLVIITLFPFAVMITTALKPAAEIFTYPPAWLPTTPRWQNFADMWIAANFGPALLNSLIVSLGATALALLVAIPAAYAMARYHFSGRGLFRQFLLVTQMLSPIVLVLGLFRLASGFGMVDTKLALILVYAAFNIAFAVWMLQSYFATIPRDLEEAAWLEGAGRFRAAVTIFMPMATPAMAVTAIFTFINAWNEFVLALTLLRSKEQYTLPLQVFSLVGGRYTIEWDQVMAATLLATLPVSILFAWLQRFLVRGLALGAVK